MTSGLMEEGTIATLLIVGAGEMTEGGRRVVALWLHRQAELLLEKGHGYKTKQRARFMGTQEEIATLEEGPPVTQQRNVLVYQP